MASWLSLTSRLGITTLALVLLGAARAASVSATIQPGIIPVGQAAQFTVTFTDAPRAGLQPPTPPTVAGLSFQYSGQSTSVQMDGRGSQISLSFNYVVTGTKEGNYTIPAIQSVVAGAPLATRPVQLKVIARNASPPAASGQQRWAYLLLVPTKQEVFVGEILPLQLQLYVVDGQDYAPSPLSNAGFVFSQLEPAGQRRVQVQGQVYHLVTHTQNAFATKAGDLTLGPAEARVTLRIPRARQRRQDPFDSFFNFDPFGRNVERRPVTLQSEQRTIKVKPLPTEGVPDTFHGAVGQFDMEVTASPTNVAVGEPIHLRIRVSGQGQLENVTVPINEGWEGFRVYPPRTQLDVTDGASARGVKTFEQDVVPLSVDVAALPEVAFSYFDPEKAIYQTVRQPSSQLLVRPASSSQTLAPIVNSDQEDNPKQTEWPQELVPLKQRLGSLAQIRPPLLTQVWFQSAIALSVFGWGAAVGWRRWQDHLAKNPRVARRLAFARKRRQMLEELHRLASAGDPAPFFAHAFRLVQEQLGERLDLPAAAITEAVLDDRVVPLGAPEDLMADLHQFFQTCNQARYAPVAESKDLPALARHVQSILDRSQRLAT